MVEYGYGGGEIRSNYSSGVSSVLWMEIWGWLMVSTSAVFSLPEASLYRGPIMKVVLFDLAVLIVTIRPEFYSGRIVGH